MIAGDRLLQAVGGLLVEAGDPDVADIAAVGLVADRPHPDDLAHDGNIDRRGGTLARDLQPDLAVGGALHPAHRLLERHALNLLVVDLGDHVARQHAGLGRGRIVDRRHHLDEAVFHRDLDAEPAELAMGGLLHVAPALLIHVARMRIERGDHAVDGAFHQLGIVGLLDIAGLDPLEHVAEQIELGVGVGTGRGLCRRHQMRPLRSRHDNGQTRARHRAEKKGKIPAHVGRPLFCCGRPRFP